MHTIKKKYIKKKEKRENNSLLSSLYGNDILDLLYG